MLNRSQFLTVINRLAVLTTVLLCSIGCADRAPGVIRFGLATAPVTFDPRLATDATSYRIGRLLYQSLVDFNASHRPVPSLARWEQPGPRHYRFYLDPGQTFHNGSDLTSADVVATYESVLNPETVSPHRGSLSNVRAINAVGPLIVDFTLHEPDPLFPGLLVIGIMPEDTLGAGTDTSGLPVGSGPFELAAVPTETRIQLRRRSDGQLIEFVTVRDATVRALKLVHGEIDLTQGSMTPELVDWLDARDEITAVHRPGTTFTYLGFNLDDRAVGDPRIRRAISLALDRETLTRHMFGGRARLAQAIFSPTHWAGHPDLEPIGHDPVEARRILEGLGYDADHPLSLAYKTSSDHFRLRVATTIQDQLAAVGIAVAISSYDWGTFYADIKSGRFQMYSLSWVGLKQPDIFRYAFHSASVPPAGANRGRYRAQNVDAMIEAAEASVELEERAALYADIQAQLLEDLPYVPLWYEDNILIRRDSITDYDTGLDGYYDALANIRRTTGS